MFREKNKGDFPYAVSYGTYWLQRYLQMYPDDADGIITTENNQETSKKYFGVSDMWEG
jgi:hypothetical protein